MTFDYVRQKTAACTCEHMYIIIKHTSGKRHNVYSHTSLHCQLQNSEIDKGMMQIS